MAPVAVPSFPRRISRFSASQALQARSVTGNMDTRNFVQPKGTKLILSVASPFGIGCLGNCVIMTSGWNGEASFGPTGLTDSA